MQITYPIKKDAKYLVACSFGPDSMALLHLLMMMTKNIVVCHVNYHKRDISNYEEEALRSYCDAAGLIFEKADAPKSAVGNFQSWARELRYAFFAKMYHKHSADALFVAHQQDDLIETYLIQKSRKSRVEYYGIEPVVVMKDMTIVRPLLSFSKQDLLDYCHENRVPFSIDVSNFETKYLRNRFRHQVVNKMTEIERYQILNEIADNNKALMTRKSEIAGLIHKKELSISALLDLPIADFNEVIIQFVKQSGKHIALSERQLSEIRKICLSKNPNIDIPLSIGFVLAKEYDVLVLNEQSKIEPYSFTLTSPGVLETPYFVVDFQDGAEDRNIKSSDYPLTIRSFIPDDCYVVDGNVCEVRRLFIDWKMPMRLRSIWPIVTDKSGTIIYIPRFRKNFIESKKSKFVVKVV